jgi:hypothetical protein
MISLALDMLGASSLSCGSKLGQIDLMTGEMHIAVHALLVAKIAYN